MRIATWNINGLRARLDFVLHWLRARTPDIVCLQELKLTDDKFPHDALSALGYHAVSHGQKAWNGVAILSREPAEVLQVGLPGQEEFGARLLVAAVSGLRVASVYCPNGKDLDHEDYGRKLAWFDTLGEYLGGLDKLAGGDQALPTVIGGDFNICPQGIDSWQEAGAGIFHTDAERSRFQALLDLGLIDLYRHKYPHDREFSWWDYRGGAFHKKRGLRIDFLLANAPALARVKAIEIDREYRKKQDGMTASDHAPVIADLDG
ncbi:MAG: exodeoxyribonuclease III [Haliangiales bacterium]